MATRSPRSKVGFVPGRGWAYLRVWIEWHARELRVGARPPPNSPPRRSTRPWLGCSTDEVRGSWAASAQGPIHIWIGVWREMGIECAIVDAADPALEIVLASAIAAAQVLPELDAIRTAPRSLQAQ